MLWRFSATASLFAQPREFKFEHLSVEHGLSQCTVGAIYQDRRGFMWFGTSDGLDRYDGYSFKHYKNDPSDTNSLSHNDITAIAEDQTGRLWVGTGEGGLNQLDRQHDRFIWYQFKPDDPQSLSNNYVEVIFADSFGMLWIGTHGGLNAFDPETKKFTRYQHEKSVPSSLSHDAVRGFYEDRAQTLWIITNAGLDQFDRRTQTFKHVITTPDLGDVVSTIHEDHAGTFWIGRTSGGLHIFDRQTQMFVRHYQHDPRCAASLGDNRVRAICDDPVARDILWIATQSEVNRFDRTTQKFLRFRHDPQNPHSLSLGTCIRLYRDRSGLFWIATDGSGLAKLDPLSPKFTHIKHEPGNPNSLSKDLPKAICEDRFGDLWIGNVWGGLDRLDRRTEKFKHYRHDPDDPWTLSDEGVLAIHEDKTGDLWIGAGNGGLNRFDREREIFASHRNAEGKRLGLTRDGVNVIGEDRDGYLWLGSDHLRKYDKRTGKTTWYRHQADDPNSLSHIAVTAIYADQKGRLWIGTAKGLNKLVPNPASGESEGIQRAGEQPTDIAFTRYLNDPDNPRSLSNNFIKTIFEDQADNLWVGTSDGLNKLVPSNAEGSDPPTETFTRYHEKDGLPNTFIYGILGDDRGNLWMSTNRGLSKFNPATGKFRNYDLQDGLQSYEFNTGAYHRSQRTGEMFFGGINGVNAFHPDSVKDVPYAPRIVITDFKKFDLPAKLEADIADLNEIKLDYEENVFSFEFAALDYTHPEKNQYAYMLEGFDQDWVFCGTRRFARYTNLDPGVYTFRVKGTNHDGVWNEQGTSVKITIVPPFWMTWWSRALAGVVVLGAIAGAVKFISAYKVRKRMEEFRRQQALQRERERISKDMHDEIGASLTKIAILSELMQNDFANAEKLRTYVQKISETAHATIDSISEIIWAINPQNNTLDNLAAYLRKCAANSLEMTPVQYRLDFPETVPGYPISAEFRRQIFMVVKEAIHNIVKHAKATEMEMKLISNDYTLEILIQDNGKGFIPETQNGCGNGLHNMSKRIAEVGGQFEIQSQPQRGTKVRIFTKIK